MLGLYFSGTGNTKYCVRHLATLLDSDATICSIEENAVENQIDLHQDIILGYPIYYSTLPKIMHDFLTKHASRFSEKRVFVIATMALFSGDGAGCAVRLLHKNGAMIHGGLHLRMPDCIGDEKVLKKSFEKNQQLIQMAKQKIEKAANNIKNHEPPREGLSLFAHLAGLFGQRLWFYHKTASYKNKPNINAQKCIACNKCVQICPMKNLSLVEGRLISAQKCTLCYRCVSFCPKQALTILGKQVYEQSYFEKYNIKY